MSSSICTQFFTTFWRSSQGESTSRHTSLQNFSWSTTTDLKMCAMIRRTKIIPHNQQRRRKVKKKNKRTLKNSWKFLCKSWKVRTIYSYTKASLCLKIFFFEKNLFFWKIFFWKSFFYFTRKEEYDTTWVHGLHPRRDWSQSKRKRHNQIIRGNLF